MQEELTRNKHYRALGEACEVPNSVAQQLPSAASGATAMAFSHSGVFLAAACGDSDGAFTLVVWNVLTGAAILKLHRAHGNYVYGLTWSPEDSALLSCSSDGSAKVWELDQYSRAARTIRPIVLRHPCYVYAAQFHPSQRNHPVIATGAHDGGVRLWDRSSGQLIVAVKVGEGGGEGEEGGSGCMMAGRGHISTVEVWNVDMTDLGLTGQ